MHHIPTFLCSMEVKYTWSDLEDGAAQIDIFQPIDESWGYSLANLTNQLASAKGKPLLVRVNSPGGTVTEGLAISNLLNGYSGDVKIGVLGYAASSASLIVAKAANATMAKDSFFMIHEPYGGTMGTAADMRRSADTTQKFEDMIANIYLDSMDKRGKKKADSEKVIRDAMKAETWYTAQEALDLGLIDNISDAVPTMPTALETQNMYNGQVWNVVKNFKNAPEVIKNKFNNINQENTMTKTTLWDQVKNLLSGVESPAETNEPIEVKADSTEMTAEQMIEHLTANGYAVTTAEEAISAEEVAELIQNEVAAQVETIKAQLKADANKGKMNVPAAKADVKAKDEDSAFSPLKAFLKSKSNM